MAAGAVTEGIAYAFLRLGEAARKAAVVFTDTGLSLFLGSIYNPEEQVKEFSLIDDPYDPLVIADFERDSGVSVEHIERFEQEMGVSFP